jgi:hypothetical protein
MALIVIKILIALFYILPSIDVIHANTSHIINLSWLSDCLTNWHYLSVGFSFFLHSLYECPTFLSSQNHSFVMNVPPSWLQGHFNVLWGPTVCHPYSFYSSDETLYSLLFPLIGVVFALSLPKNYVFVSLVFLVLANPGYISQLQRNDSFCSISWFKISITDWIC